MSILFTIALNACNPYGGLDYFVLNEDRTVLVAECNNGESVSIDLWKN